MPEHPFYADAPTPIPIAHRGGDAAGPEKENSLVAFESAWLNGISYGETDTVATADGVALAIHGSRNARQERQTGLPVRSQLERMTFDEVQRNVRVGGEQVPALEELFVTFPGMRFFVDPKTDNSVKPLADLIKTYDLHDSVSVGAFNFARTKAVAELSGDARKLCKSIGVIGGLAFLGDQIDFPLAAQYIRRSGATQFAVPHNRVNPPMVERAHEHGLRVILWTPNTEAELARAFDTDADGVMSDRTEMVKAMADARRADSHL
ncbi:MAG TPA: glycerophosphodiester phosphodiesterase family protein [Candidatus Saccharimonadales bacterium]|nr:glycerophosphodiester phosphodiesterase family protein [Candidatus Saccharimonadales bacterium]